MTGSEQAVRLYVTIIFRGAQVHAAALAEELGMTEVLCPPIPGAFSALGLVGSDLKRDYVRTVYVTTDSADPADIEAAFADLEADGSAMLDRAGVPAARTGRGGRAEERRVPTPRSRGRAHRGESAE